MQVQQQHATLADAPVIFTFAGDLRQAGQRGTILFYHGFNAAKEVGHKELGALAARGFLAIGVDNVGHGARRHPDFDQRFGEGAELSWRQRFLDDVRATADEVPRLVNALLEDGLSRDDRLGVSGISMGGYIAYAAVLRERRLRAAAPILGSPSWGTPDSPDHHLSGFFPVALLSQNAGRDENVPPRHARGFHAALRHHYQAAPDREKYLEYPNSGHFMSEEDWNQVLENLQHWFEQYLV